MILLECKVIPNASKNEITDLELVNGSLKLRVRIQVPAMEGRANQELIKFLSKCSGLRKNLFTLKSGQKSRNKLLEVEAKLNAEDLLAIMKKEQA